MTLTSETLLESARIIICEDEFLVAEELRDRLTMRGHKIIGVVDRGEDAVELARETKPDLALLDIRLRGAMSGTDVAKILASELEIPCIFLTAYADRETIQEAKRSGPLGYLLKPLRAQELEIAIETGLSAYRKQRLADLKLQRQSWGNTLVAAGVDATVVAALNEMVESERDRVMKQVCAGIAHHFNNILATVIGSLDWLNETDAFPDCQRGFLTQALDGCEKARSLVQRLLWVSGQGLFQIEFTDVRHVVDQVVLEVKQTVPPQIRLNTIVPFEKFICLADKAALTHVVRALLLNSIQSVEGEGEITVCLESARVEGQHVKNRQAKPGTYVTLTIKDNGVGIPPAKLAAITEPFHSLESDISSLGLGIPSTVGIAQAMGGWLTIESHVGTGTITTLQLPQLVIDQLSKNFTVQKKTIPFQTKLSNSPVSAAFEHFRAQLEARGVVPTHD